MPSSLPEHHRPHRTGSPEAGHENASQQTPTMQTRPSVSLRVIFDGNYACCGLALLRSKAVEEEHGTFSTNGKIYGAEECT